MQTYAARIMVTVLATLVTAIAAVVVDVGYLLGWLFRTSKILDTPPSSLICLLLVLIVTCTIAAEGPPTFSVTARLRDESFAGSDGPVIAWSPDGTRLANGRSAISFWDVKTGRKVSPHISGHPPAINRAGLQGLAYTPDGKTLISTGADGAIRFWNPSTGDEIREILPPFGMILEGLDFPSQMPLYSLAVSSNSRYVAVAAHDHLVHLWNIESGQLERSFGESVAKNIKKQRIKSTGGSWEVGELPRYLNRSPPKPIFSPDSESLAVANHDEVKVWNVSNGKLRFQIPDWGDCAYSPDGRFVITAKYDGVQIWEANSGRSAGKFTHETKIFTPLAFLRDGSLATGGADGRGIRIWSFPEGRLLRTLDHGVRALDALAVSPDGKLLAATVRQSRVLLWDLEENHRISGPGHADRVTALAFSPDDRILISASDDASVRTWNVAGWKPLHSLTLPLMHANVLQFLADKERVLVGDSTGKTRLVKLPDLTVEHTLNHRPDSRVTGYAIRKQRIHVGVNAFQGYVETWDSDSMRLVKTHQSHETYGMRMAVAADQTLVASGDYSGNVVVWRDDVAKPVTAFRVDGNHVEAIALSSDGRALATIAWNNSVPGPILQLWDPEKGIAQYRMQVGSSGITGAAWSPDGRMLAVASMGSPGLQIYRDGRLHEVASAEGIYSLAWSHDGSLLAAGGNRGEIVVWKLQH